MGDSLDHIVVVQWLIQNVVKLVFEARVAMSRNQLMAESLEKILVVQWLIQQVIKLLFEALMHVSRRWVSHWIRLFSFSGLFSTWSIFSLRHLCLCVRGR